MNLYDLRKSCPYGDKSTDCFTRVAHGRINFLEVDSELKLHIKGCEICKQILKATIKVFKRERSKFPDKMNTLLDRLDPAIHTLCTFDEICGECWDTERFGSVEQYKVSCKQIKELFKDRNKLENRLAELMKQL